MIERFDEGRRMAQAVAYGPFFETAGICADDPSLDVRAQARQALASIDALLERGGVSRRDLVRVQAWLADYRDFDAFNEVYDAWIEGCPKPVRACVESGLGGYAVEIRVLAYRGA
ncbi:hypothetical protein B6S59_19885 [Pseudomonas sp. A46]|jgi:enamine deaminase RidA (YjgF/YER057c/UK114 family)|uniref:RidA family protein n=1 Tax=Metapseudomonas furukawaii TaxID=1149133 RepID=UPI000B4A24C9|nr:RidA family protein [Pseudomonas sp. A46]OWJ92569.1 hypothetical protein B6S59_19885 [Pseudomonas sp. A46]